MLSQIFKSMKSWMNYKVCNFKYVKTLILKNEIRECSTSVNALPKKFVLLRSKKKNNKVITKEWILWVVPVITFGLGTWQVQRKIWKDGLIKNLKEVTKLDPVDLPTNLDDLKQMEFCAVRIKGRFDHSREFLMGPRSLLINNQPSTSSSMLSRNSSGYWVITPFTLSDRDLTILVNRGWVSNKNKLQKTRLGGQISGEVEIVGLVRLSEPRQPFGMRNIPEKGVWMYRDLKKMSEIFGTYPILIDADASSSVPEGPIGGQSMISLPNNHLDYIITWYGLSAATSFMCYKRFFK